MGTRHEHISSDDIIPHGHVMISVNWSIILLCKHDDKLSSYFSKMRALFFFGPSVTKCCAVIG